MINKKEYKQLIKQANAANKAYYDNDDPIMGDPEYDSLMQKIKAFEAEYPDLIASNSPTQHVGGTASKSSFVQVEHAVPMLSLQDVFSEEDIEDFLQKFPDDEEYSVEEKIDGLSLSVVYEYGVLKIAKTRGNGLIGEDVTENAKHIVGIPRTLHAPRKGGNIGVIEVRCEVYLPIEEFERINKSLEAEGKKTFANPRNAAAGILRTKNVEAVKKAKLNAFAFNVQRVETFDDASKKRWKNHAAALDGLAEMGFKVVPHYFCGKTAVINWIRFIGKHRYSLPYWIDGAVVKLISIKNREAVGETAKYPKWAVAFKYPPEEKETVIRDIVLQTGRTGRITPVAVLDPVYLAGTKVEKATLHNPEIIEKLQVNISDTVLVRKAAEIIPEIIKVTKKCEATETSLNIYDIFSHTCPSCGESIMRGYGDKGAYCYNLNCPAQIAKRFEFWASRDCMDIKGFGPALIEKFIQKGWLKTIPDIYRLKDHREEMLEMDGFGEKAADNLLAAIEESKNRDLDRVIKAFGIPGVGRHIGKILANYFPHIFSMHKIRASSLINHVEFLGIGEVSANAISNFFNDEDEWKTIVELDALGVNLKSSVFYKTPFDDKGAWLLGLTFVITGTLPSMKREEAAKLIEENGGTVLTSVSKKTDYLLCGENAGSKLEKAKSLGIKIISEQDLMAMLEEQN